MRICEVSFEERGGLYGYFRMETTARDYVEGGMEKLRFAVSLDDAQWFSGFLQKYRYTCNPHYYLDFGWGLSSGENNLLRLFTSLYYIFERDYANEKNGHYQIYNYDKTHGRTACDSVILIMDEADLTYHPEWQRRFLSVITAFCRRSIRRSAAGKCRFCSPPTPRSFWETCRETTWSI